MRADCDQQPEIHRHRAVIRRSDFSLPLKCVLRDNLLDRGGSLFDYRCGYGDDIRRLQGLGFDCDSCDPMHRPDVPPRAADAVNLGYVHRQYENRLGPRVVFKSVRRLHQAATLWRKKSVTPV